YLPEWQALMLVHLLFDALPGGAAALPELDALNAFYDERLYPFSHREPAYRAIWVHDLSVLPDVPLAAGAASAADEAEFRRLLAATEAAAHVARDHAIEATLREMQARIDGVERERRRVDEDRQRIDIARLEALAECERLVADRDRVERAR